MTHPQYGEPRAVTPFASVLLERNPGPMTLEGTNTWILRAPGASACVVVDPGEDDDDHLTRVAAAAGPVERVLLTHGHHDHSGGAAAFHTLTGAPVSAVDPAHRYGGDGLDDDQTVEAGGLRIRVLRTPGHTADSVCLVVADPVGGADAVVLTGDTVLGRGTTVVAHPDGVLADYLATLRRLVQLGPLPVLPGHGPDLPAIGPVAEEYLTHRLERVEQVRAALAAIGADAAPRQVVELVYADVDPTLWAPAELSVRATLDFLRDEQASRWAPIV